MMWKIVLPVLAAVFFVVGSEAAGIPGGTVDIDLNDEYMRKALNFAVVQHNRDSDDLYLSRVAEVIRAQSQVVAGLKYTITVRMGKTPCRKDAAQELCEIHEDPESARPYQCTFTVWTQLWINYTMVLKEEC